MKTRVRFETVYFEAAHGRAPRGDGQWAFCPADKYRSGGYLAFVVWQSGTYAQAKAKARVHFAAAGVEDVVVCS